MTFPRMAPATNSRRRFLAAAAALGVALSVALPMAGAMAAPFSSDRITVRTEGTGPDVVLIPGVNATPRTWATTVAAVPGYRYHLVQISGFGGQAAGANKEGPVIVPAADEIARYIKETGIKPAVVGHSLGGTVGMTLASRHPDALSRLMVVDMFPYMGMLFAERGATPEQVGQVADRIAAGMRAVPDADREARATATITAMVNTASMRPIAVEDSVKSDRDVGTRAYREVILTNLIPELAKVTVPVTVLYVQPNGAPLTTEQLDGIYKYGYGQVKNLRLKRIDDSAHFIMWDQPKRFQGELKSFLEAK
jgi:pimeloyl-ACP methyl ester carboxylesterase